MTEPTKPAASLADLAERVRTKANNFMLSWHGEELARQLRDRLLQLETLTERAAKIAKQHTLIGEADPRTRVSRQRLSPRLRGLVKLEAAAKLDITAVVEAKAIDVEGLIEAFKDAEQTLFETWQKFARPPKEAVGAEALADVPELEETTKELRTTRQKLEEKAKQPPSGTSDITEVRALHKRLTELGDQLRTHGCDEEVLAFLVQSRSSPRGVPLSDVLKNPKLRAWLETKRNAGAFRVVHESALNLTSILRT